MKFPKVTTGFCQSYHLDSLAMQSHSHEIVTAADVAPYMEVTTTFCYTLKGVGSRGLTALQEM